MPFYVVFSHIHENITKNKSQNKNRNDISYLLQLPFICIEPKDFFANLNAIYVNDVNCPLKTLAFISKVTKKASYVLYSFLINIVILDGRQIA